MYIIHTLTYKNFKYFNKFIKYNLLRDNIKEEHALTLTFASNSTLLYVSNLLIHILNNYKTYQITHHVNNFY